MNKTITPSLETIERNWFLVDAKDKTLGRLATEIATVLRGKNKPTFTPHLDTGDFVIVVNAEKVEVTGKKASQKLYRRHSGRPGGMKIEKFESLQERIPERIIEQAENDRLLLLNISFLSVQWRAGELRKEGELKIKNALFFRFEHGQSL